MSFQLSSEPRVARETDPLVRGTIRARRKSPQTTTMESDDQDYESMGRQPLQQEHVGVADYNEHTSINSNQLYPEQTPPPLPDTGSSGDLSGTTQPPLLEIPEEIYAIRKAALRVLKPLTRTWVSVTKGLFISESSLQQG